MSRLNISLPLVVAIAALGVTPALAQVPAGRCVDQFRGQSFTVFSNLLVVQDGNPQNAAFAIRDPSGMTFVRLPALLATQSFFVDWQGQIIEINQFGWQPVGFCQFTQNLAQPPAINVGTVQYSQWGVRSDGVNRGIPNTVVDQNVRYTIPALANERTAQQCWQQANGARNAFIDCMAGQILEPDQRNAYQCARRHSNNQDELAICVLRARLGANEQRALDHAARCYRQHGSDWSRYPICMAGQNADENTMRAVGCLQRQAASGEMSFWGMALCYGGPQLQIRPELVVAIECASAAGGEPISFVACTGGRLTATEVEKCFSRGIGGDGCFGPNNEIIRAARSIGDELGRQFGPNNDIVRNWNNAVNDITRGPGPNNDAARHLRNAANDLARGPGRNNDVVRAIDRVIPGFRSLF